jgi:hypothetical protein
MKKVARSARNHAGDEQLGNRHVGGHAVLNHDDGRRDQQPQRAGAAQRAYGNVLGVAALFELGQRDFSDGGASRGA